MMVRDPRAGLKEAESCKLTEISRHRQADRACRDIAMLVEANAHPLSCTGRSKKDEQRCNSPAWRIARGASKLPQ
jgi:hypothetical protein